MLYRERYYLETFQRHWQEGFYFANAAELTADIRIAIDRDTAPDHLRHGFGMVPMAMCDEARRNGAGSVSASLLYLLIWDSCIQEQGIDSV